MILKRNLIFGGILALFAATAGFWGCQPSCDNIPTEALAQVRILDAVSNANVVIVYIDGKLFDSAWYNVTNAYSGRQFGYRSTYLSDGSPLRAGYHHVVAQVIEGVSNTLATIVDTNFILHGTRQSLIYLGKVNGLPPQKPRVLFLNDVLREPVPTSFARFIHAVPDIQGDTGSLDVYFASKPKVVNGVSNPDLHIRFGHISHSPNDDNGTGLSAADYIQFPAVIPGLVIMPAGDTNINDAIVNFSYSTVTNGILATIVIRGETEPTGSEPAASALMLEDGLESPGTASFEAQTFGVRIVNAARYDSLSLLISGSNDKTPGVPRSIGFNQPFATQAKATDIFRDSVSQYMALGPGPAYFDFWYGWSANPNDTTFRFRIWDPKANDRFTFIAIDTIPHNKSGTPGLDSVVLVDSVAPPANAAMGRVRLVNTTADYTAHFSLGATNYAMKQRDVKYIDLPVGANSIRVSDGNSGVATIAFNLTNGSPLTIFFLPSDAQHAIPYTISIP